MKRGYFLSFERFREGIRDLLPSYFAMVMATGIVAIATKLLQIPGIAEGLGRLNQLLFLILTSLFVLRFLLHRRHFLADAVDHAKGAGFFTVAAGTSVLGSQLIILDGNFFVAKLLFWCAVTIWLVLIYAFFAGVTICADKPTLEGGMNGIWLVSVVATQSISILGTLLSQSFVFQEEAVLFFTLSLFFIGAILYFLIITLIFYRLTFFRLQAEQFAPPYWINMGALAITTLAGTQLVKKAGAWGFLSEILPFLKGATVLFWSMGTWWIPLILILGIWRHISGRLPFAYHPQYWGMVFPLGMYTVATHRMSEVLQFEFIEFIPKSFVYFALTAWLLGAGLFVGRLVTRLR